MEPVEVIVAGHVCLDIIPTLAGPVPRFAPGRMIEASGVVLSTGGAVANTGLSLHRLGIRTQLIGKLGDDLFGAIIRQIIAGHGHGLTDQMVIAAGESSSYTMILSPPNTDRMFIYSPGCNATFGAEDVAEQVLAQARLLHFGYPTVMARMYRDGGAELVTLLRRAKACGLTTALDFAMPDDQGPDGQVDWAPILAASLPYVDIFVPSVEELLLTMRRAESDRLAAQAENGSMIDLITPALLADLADQLLMMGAKVVGLKVSYRGFYLRTAGVHALADIGRAAPGIPAAWADRELWAPCYATTVVGTTGAGDAAIAGFLFGLLRGMTPEQALSAACAVGACCVEAADAISGVRDWPATAGRLVAGWARLPLALTAPGWRWHAPDELWIGSGDGA